MMGEYAKSSYFDFAGFANAGGRDDLDEDQLTRLRQDCGYHPELDGKEMQKLALVHSENMYRTSSLLAYGAGLASFRDISDFVSSRRVKTTMRSENEGEDGIEITIELPYMPQSFDIDSLWLQVPRTYDSPLSSMPFRMPPVKIECIEECGIVLLTATAILWLGIVDRKERKLRSAMLKEAPSEQREELIEKAIEIDMDNLKAIREPYKLLGQLIVNAHVARAYVGLFDGKPAFSPVSYVDQLWQAMSELSDKQLPGLCPVCGKVIDRRRDARGGHPKNTCCNAHSDKFTNLKARIRKKSLETDKPLTRRNELEEAVRKERWEVDGRNERPLRSLFLC